MRETDLHNWQDKNKTKYPIGLRFIRATGKRKDVETITDILTTTNNKGEVVSIRYVAAHDFAGQTVMDRDIPPSTIARSKILLF